MTDELYEQYKNDKDFKHYVDQWAKNHNLYISLEDEQRAIGVAQEIVEKIKREHDEQEHGVSWRTVSLEIVPQEERYKIGTIIEWKYRVRDSY